MLNLGLWLKSNGFRVDQVQAFLATPMALASAMYHTGYNPLKKIKEGESEEVDTVRGAQQRKLHKAFLRYHDAENWPLLREALKKMGRMDLIGNSQRHLVPAWQPQSTKAGGKDRGDFHHRIRVEKDQPRGKAGKGKGNAKPFSRPPRAKFAKPKGKRR